MTRDQAYAHVEMTVATGEVLEVEHTPGWWTGREMRCGWLVQACGLRRMYVIDRMVAHPESNCVILTCESVTAGYFVEIDAEYVTNIYQV